MTVIRFPKGRRPRHQGRIRPRSPLPENVCWLREPYLGPQMTPERFLLAAIVKSMPDRASAKVLQSLSVSVDGDMQERALRVVAIDIACGSFAPIRPAELQ